MQVFQIASTVIVFYILMIAHKICLILHLSLNLLQNATNRYHIELLILDIKKTIKSNLLFYSIYYADACNECAGPISVSMRLGNTATLKEISQQWRAIGNAVSDLTGPRFESRTSRFRDERVKLDLLAGQKNDGTGKLTGASSLLLSTNWLTWQEDSFLAPAQIM